MGAVGSESVLSMLFKQVHLYFREIDEETGMSDVQVRSLIFIDKTTYYKKTPA